MAMPTRREILKRSGRLAALAGAGLLGERAAAEPLPPALRALGGVAVASADIVLAVDDAVENGAIVPVAVNSLLPDTQEIFVVVEANPQPLAARFTIPAGTEAYVSTRIRMAQSSTVWVAVRADGKLYCASKAVQVTVGGCG